MGLPKDYLNAAIYLYETAAGAIAGTQRGGTGFTVGYPYADDPDRFHYYYVTNRHVIERAHAPVVRINDESGTTQPISYVESEWEFHPDGDDVAVAQAKVPPTANIAFVRTSQFVTRSMLDSLSIGTGEPVYMIGRFVGFEGTRQNIPTVRFGNIAMLPFEKIRCVTTGKLVDSYLADMRSRLGYSGSPTYVIATNHHPMFPSQQTYLLGVEWADWTEQFDVCSKLDGKASDEWYIDIPSGICCVSPAWRLLELLENEPFVSQRREAENAFRAKYVTPKAPRLT